jgi:hypothetical protein
VCDLATQEGAILALTPYCAGEMPEILRGHRGRLKWILGIATDQQLYRFLHGLSGKPKTEALCYGRVLSGVLGLPFEEILDRHSLYPLAYALWRFQANQATEVERENRERHALPFRRPAAVCLARAHPRVAPDDEVVRISADSTGRRNTFVEHLSWRPVAQSLPRTLVQFSRNGIQAGL